MKVKIINMKIVSIIMAIIYLFIYFNGSLQTVQAQDDILLNDHGKIAINGEKENSIFLQQGGHLKIKLLGKSDNGGTKGEFYVSIYNKKNDLILFQPYFNCNYTETLIIASLDTGAYKIKLTNVSGKSEAKYDMIVTVSKDTSLPDGRFYLNKQDFCLKVGNTNKLSFNDQIIAFSPKKTNDTISKDMIKWESSDTNVATVDNDGIVTAVSTGVATIKASYGNDFLECHVSVIDPILSDSQLTIDVGKSKILTIMNYGELINWSSSDETVATVSNGIVKAIRNGKVMITAKLIEGSVLTCKVTVKGLSINNSELNLYIGDKKSLEIYGSNSKVTWSSSNKKVASVSATGYVTTKASGTATITGKVSGKTFTCIVEVHAKPDFTVHLNGDTVISTSMAVMSFTNNGKLNMTVTSDQSKLINESNHSYDRNLYLVSTDNNSEKLSSVTIKPGKTVKLYFAIDGNNSWYDNETTITYTVKYDNLTYLYQSGFDYGTKLVNQ